MKKKFITAQEFDDLFDNDQDVFEYLDLDQAVRPNLDVKRVNVDFPAWMVNGLDQQARLLGITRQSVIKIWISEKLKAIG